MKKGQSPFFTGMALCLVIVYLIIYFSLNSMWNVGTVIVLVLISAVAAFQFVIHFKFFKNDKQNTHDSRKMSVSNLKQKK